MMLNISPLYPELFPETIEKSLPLDNFPKTRYQGSKRRLLKELQKVFQKIPAGTALDLYAGTATVSLLLRMLGWNVTSNDFLRYNNATARVMLGSVSPKLTDAAIERDLRYLLREAPVNLAPLVFDNFSGIYFPDDENLEIDRFCQNISEFSEEMADFYRYVVGQSLLMKRPYNLFHRANLNMRTRSVTRSFGNAVTWSKPISEHAIKIALRLKSFPFPNNGRVHRVTSQNTLDLIPLSDRADLVYLDPPYLNKAGMGIDYSRFYHFLDGLCDYELFGKFDETYPHRPIVAHESAWLSHKGALKEIDRVLNKWRNSTIVLSYRNDGKPTFDEIEAAFLKANRSFTTVDALAYKYALSKKEDTSELILISPQA